MVYLRERGLTKRGLLGLLVGRFSAEGAVSRSATMCETEQSTERCEAGHVCPLQILEVRDSEGANAESRKLIGGMSQ